MPNDPTLTPPYSSSSSPHLPQFQAGAFDAWGPSAPGYDNCRTLTGPEFESVFYKGLWAANAKMISYYMVYGWVVLFSFSGGEGGEGAILLVRVLFVQAQRRTDYGGNEIQYMHVYLYQWRTRVESQTWVAHTDFFVL